MENIRQAIERAKGGKGAASGQQRTGRIDVAQRTPVVGDALRYQPDQPDPPIREIELNSKYLLSNRIVSHIVTDPRSRPFDMLRTQILQSMDKKTSRILAITSPTPGCGKTVTALNLAFSIARQPERSVLLLDLDFQKPKVANYLGLQFDNGALGLLEGQTTLSNAIIHARVDDQKLMVLPTKPTSGSGELMASREMASLFQDIKRECRSQTIIVDLPPILSSDDVITILPQVDAVLFVVAVGTTTVSQIEECNKHLQSADVLRIVVNKVTAASTNYYYY
jgi:protein-tyrosine kinase